MSKTEGKQVNFRDFERTHDDVKKAEHLKLPLDRIKKRKGFNPRDLSKKDTVEKIEAMKQSYMMGQYVPPLLVKMAGDGEHVEITDGECRFTAATLADKELKEQGLPGILFLEVMRFTGNDKEALVQTVLSNEGERLTPLEQAEVVRRLGAMGLNREQISNELHKSIGWIDRLIVIAKLPEKVKMLVREDKISPEVAVKFVKEHGEEGAEAAILAKLNGKSVEAPEGDTKSKAKVTAKDTKKGDEASPAAVKKDRLDTAKDVAFYLPEKLTRVKTLKDDTEYQITVTGAALKALMKLQDLYEKEIAEAAAQS
jgi:ParB-like chromosome segregation protein Spo0J